MTSVCKFHLHRSTSLGTNLDPVLCHGAGTQNCPAPHLSSLALSSDKTAFIVSRRIPSPSITGFVSQTLIICLHAAIRSSSGQSLVTLADSEHCYTQRKRNLTGSNLGDDNIPRCSCSRHFVRKAGRLLSAGVVRCRLALVVPGAAHRRNHGRRRVRITAGSPSHPNSAAGRLGDK
jgi:hypothetical protein